MTQVIPFSHQIDDAFQLLFWYTVTGIKTRDRPGKCRPKRTTQTPVEAWIGERWTHWFDEASLRTGRASDGAPITTLSGVFDQAALRGTLTKLGDLNLTLLSVSRIESRGAKPNGKDGCIPERTDIE
jgi:hypothetical protein